MAYQEVITYNSSTALNFNSSLVVVSGGALTLVGSPYTTTNPQVTSQHQNTISALSSFAETSTKPALTAVQYQLVLNGTAYWWSAALAKWTAATIGSSATSNSATVINAHVSTLFSDLLLLTNQFLTLNIFLMTTSTLATPILATNTIGYTWVNSNASTINQCVVSGYLNNLAGNVPLPTAAHPAQLLVACDRAFFHGTNFIEPFTQSFSFSVVDGSLSASVIETATPGVPLNFSVTYWDGNSVRTSKLFNAITPNQPSISLSNLSSVYPYDFG